MSDIKFEWTDELVEEFACKFGTVAIDQFKRSKEKDIPKDWEIIEFRSVSDPNNCFNQWRLVEPNYYQCSLPSATKFSLKDMLYGSDGNVSNGRIAIHSAKRLSDGEVFTVRDKTNYGVIEKFSIERGNKLFVNCGNPYITHISDIYHKPKVPLFTTEDGVEIIEGSYYFPVNKNFIRSGRCNGLGWYNPMSGEKYFSTKEKAEEYIQLNKPIEVTQKELIDNFLVMTRHSGKYDSLSTFFQAKIKP